MEPPKRDLFTGDCNVTAESLKVLMCAMPTIIEPAANPPGLHRLEFWTPLMKVVRVVDNFSSYGADIVPWIWAEAAAAVKRAILAAYNEATFDCPEAAAVISYCAPAALTTFRSGFTRKPLSDLDYATFTYTHLIDPVITQQRHPRRTWSQSRVRGSRSGIRPCVNKGGELICARPKQRLFV
jgi:hypothetical protein